MAQRSHLWIADKKINIHLDKNCYHLLLSKKKERLAKLQESIYHKIFCLHQTAEILLFFNVKTLYMCTS